MEQTKTSDVIEVVKLDIINMRVERMHCIAAIGRMVKLGKAFPRIADVMDGKATDMAKKQAELSGKIEVSEGLLLALEKITP